MVRRRARWWRDACAYGALGGVLLHALLAEAFPAPEPDVPGEPGDGIVPSTSNSPVLHPVEVVNEIAESGGQVIDATNRFFQTQWQLDESVFIRGTQIIEDAFDIASGWFIEALAGSIQAVAVGAGLATTRDVSSLASGVLHNLDVINGKLNAEIHARERQDDNLLAEVNGAREYAFMLNANLARGINAVFAAANRETGNRNDWINQALRSLQNRVGQLEHDVNNPPVEVPDPHAPPDPGGQPGPAPNPTPIPDPEPFPDPNPQPVPDPNPQPAPDPDPQPAPDPEPDPEPDPGPELTIPIVIGLIGDAVAPITAALPRLAERVADEEACCAETRDWRKTKVDPALARLLESLAFFLALETLDAQDVIDGIKEFLTGDGLAILQDAKDFLT